MTETFKPYEPEDPGGYDYDDYPYEDQRGGRVLWGRVIVLGLALVVAFFVGRLTGAGGADEAELEQLRTQLSAAQDKNEQLEQELATARAAETTETPAADATAGEGEDADREPQTQTYTVQRGDTLRGIAQTFCGDPSLDDLIATENGIDDATQLSVGETLTLPAQCSG